MYINPYSSPGERDVYAFCPFTEGLLQLLGGTEVLSREINAKETVLNDVGGTDGQRLDDGFLALLFYFKFPPRCRCFVDRSFRLNVHVCVDVHVTYVNLVIYGCGNRMHYSFSEALEPFFEPAAKSLALLSDRNQLTIEFVTVSSIQSLCECELYEHLLVCMYCI